jgi:diaminohydroxyphosphoribosylaminopyrimidine deaminase / 5-amino-6-(5-phosphoribosylamino)uracil reductase
MTVEPTQQTMMQQAIALAQQAEGMTSPNPLVGAVVVKHDQITGRGYHHKAGTPHAEIHALNNAGADTENADMYVTLEPCSTTGRTPPCTEAIIKAGIKRVYIGSLDPNPAHAGRAVAILRQAGIEVFTGIETVACDALNEAFFKWITSGEPLVVLKLAITLDGRIACANGQSQWITGPEARGRVQQLRRRADAIMVGGETVRKDNPGLIVRDPEDWSSQPRRLIVSRTLTPETASELMCSGPAPEIVAPQSSEEWQNLKKQLGSEQVTELLIEGGGELAAEALHAGIVDIAEFHIAPKILGGKDSRPAVGGANPLSLAEAWDLKDVSVEILGKDIIVHGKVKISK